MEVMGKTIRLAKMLLSQVPIALEPGKALPRRTMGPVTREMTTEINEPISLMINLT